MSWSQPQRTLFLRACTAAGWSPEQRYLAMKHAGCPIDGQAKRPSVKHARNSQASFEAVMALAEASAAIEGRSVPTPRNGGTWRDKSEGSRRTLLAKAKRIAAEAVRKCPGQFDDDLLTYAARHVTQGDSTELPVGGYAYSIDLCDEGQLVRVVELLRAMVGRAFVQAGCTAESFEIPPVARQRGEKARDREGAINAA